MNRLFIYGTLMPGDTRWPLVAADVVAMRRATVTGRLYDTGFEYPGARFDHAGTVHGWLLELRQDTLGPTLERLDEIEGTVVGAYERVTITTEAGVDCWSYQIGVEVEGMRDLDGVWPVWR